MVTMNPDGKITLYDNMSNIDEEKISKKIKHKIVEENSFQDEKISRAKEKILLKAERENIGSTINLIDEYDFYYSKTDEFYHIAKFNIINPDKTTTQSYYESQLN